MALEFILEEDEQVFDETVEVDDSPAFDEEPEMEDHTEPEMESYRIEFNIYHFVKDDPDVNSLISQFEQRLTSFNAVNSVEIDKDNDEYTLYRLDDPQYTVSDSQGMKNFLQHTFREFESLLSSILDASDNFVKVRLVTMDNPPQRVPGRSFNLLMSSDIKQMFIKLQMK